MKKYIVILIVVLLSLLAACGNSGGSATGAGADGNYDGVTVRMAQSFGMAFAPCTVMQELGLLEKHLPGAKLEGHQISGGSAINEAFIAGQLDIGFMGIPPMLIAWDKGVGYKIVTGVSVPPWELMVRDSSIKSVADFTEADKIAVPGIGSLQHIFLAMAAERELGDVNALDNNIIVMPHPDAFTALVSGTDIVAHFAGIPHIGMEMDAGFHSILSAIEAYGQKSSIVCVTNAAFHDGNPNVYDGFVAALSEAVDLINAQDPAAIKALADVENISEEEVVRNIEWPGNSFETPVYGAMGLARFMYEQGFIDSCPESTEDIMWGNAVAVDK